jgi:cytochrome c biogenesis protein CcmG/thiol:disulfide interchange protein DsbE
VSNRPNRTPSRSAKVSQASRAGSSNALLWVVLAVVVVIAGIVALAVTRESSPEGGAASPSGGTVVPSGDLHHGTVVVDGTPLPVTTESGTDPAVGDQLPSIEGQQFDGSPIVIEGGADGKPMIVMTLAHWCPHCRAEVPRVQEWLDENGMPSDVDLVSVATATDESRPNFSPGAWLRREGWSVPTLVDDEQAMALDALGVDGFPGFVVVDAQGRVVARTSGEKSVAQWEALLDAARTGQVPA